MKRFIQNILPWLPIIAILLVAAYLRVYRIGDYMTFLGDEGRDVLVVKRMIVDHKWTLLGPTASVGGFFMGPVYYYFMMPFLWAWKLNPVGPAVMVALFGIATVYLVYVVGTKWFSKTVGLIAALLYAVSPIVIAFSRSSWNPNVVPFFALLSLYMLWKVIQGGDTKNLLWVGLCAGIGVQLHYTYLFLIVAQCILIVWHWKKTGLLGVGYTVGGFLIGFSPFLAFEVRHGFTNSRAIVEFVFAGKDTGFTASHFFGNIGDVTVRLFGRFLLRIPEVGALGNLMPHVKNSWIYGQFLLALGGILSLLTVGIRARKKRDAHLKTTFILLCVWAVIPLVLFGVYKKNIYDYYFGILFPLPFFLTALLIQDVMKIPKIGRWIGACFVVALLVFNWHGRPFRFEPNRQLAQVESIARVVVQQTHDQPFNFALIADGNSDHAYRYFFEIWGKKPVTIENMENDPQRQTVTDQLLIVCENVFCEPLGNSLWEVAGFGRAEISGVWDVSVVKVYKLIHYKE